MERSYTFAKRASTVTLTIIILCFALKFCVLLIVNPCYDIEIIKHEKIIEVWRIMHIQADELMRKELARMIRSLEGKNKKKKDKKKKDKKSKKDKKKNKKDKDPFSNRTIESLWEELVQQRIIIQ